MNNTPLWVLVGLVFVTQCDEAVDRNYAKLRMERLVVAVEGAQLCESECPPCDKASSSECDCPTPVEPQ